MMVVTQRLFYCIMKAQDVASTSYPFDKLRLL